MNEIVELSYCELPESLRAQLEKDVYANYSVAEAVANEWNELDPDQRLDLIHECTDWIDTKAVQ